MSSHTLLEKTDFSELAEHSYIIEVGSQREPQPPDNIANSTCFLDRLAQAHNLRFKTVDFSKESYELAKSYVGDKAVLSDGAEFLRNFNQPISILYLDNFDVIYDEKHQQSLMRRVGTAYDEHNEIITNERSAEVHLEQVEEALPLLTKPSYICIDDTLERESGWWGKGAKAVPFLLSKGYDIVCIGPDGVLLKGHPIF